MKKRVFGFWKLSLVFVILFGINVYAVETAVPAKVNLFVEGNGYTIGCAEVSANTVIDALEAYNSINKRLEISIERSGTQQRIISIGGIMNGVYGEDTGWYGAVVRDGIVLRGSNYLNMALEDDDDVYIYYGKQDTIILPSVDCEIKDGTAVFTLVKTRTVWEETDGKWQSTQFEECLADVKIHIMMPNGMGKILITNECGQALMKLNSEGVYGFYAEAYVKGEAPKIVKTKDETFVWGFDNAQ